MKYTVNVHNMAEFEADGAGDENFVMVVSNKAGRQWVSKAASACPGNVAEEAMVIEEMINNGEKLIKDAWTEVVSEDAQLDAMIAQQTQEGIERASGLS